MIGVVMAEDQSNLGPAAEDDVQGHMQPDEATMFGEARRSEPRRPQRAGTSEDEDDVEGHGSSFGPVPQTGRPPRELDR